MKMNKKLKKGFTLVELVVVIAVIAILAGVSVGAYFGITASANASAAEQEGKAFHTNLVLLANTPDNDYCTINSKGLTYGVKTPASGSNSEVLYTADEIVAKIASDSGVSYEGYTITFTQDATTGSDDELDYISFKHKNGSTVVLDIVTGAKISTNA